DALHGDDIVGDVAGQIVERIGVFASLAVKVRAHTFDGFDGRRMRYDDDVVHAFQGGEPAGAQLVIEIRPARTLIDVLLAGDGHDQEVTQRLGFLEVHDVARVDQVEGAVALDDLLPLAPQLFEVGRRLVKGNDLRAQHAEFRVCEGSRKAAGGSARNAR